MNEQSTANEDAIPVEDGLLFAVTLDGKGNGTLRDWAAVEGWRAGDPALWAHLEVGSPHVERWLTRESGIPREAADALIVDETRPRTLRIGDGLLVVLRGVNLNPGSEPEDMVAIRIWIERERIITVRHQRLKTPRDVLARLLRHGDGPVSAADTFATLAEQLASRMNSVIADFDDRLDAMEEQVESREPAALRSALSRLRHEGVALRRYLAPQRDALNYLITDAPDFFDDRIRHRLRETTNHTLRYVEDLEAARDRAVVILDEVSNKVSESMNRTMYVLSIVAAIFLPLSFVTGLLGINVGGMPGVESGLGFVITCVILILLLVLEVMILRRLKWM